MIVSLTKKESTNVVLLLFTGIKLSVSFIFKIALFVKGLAGVPAPLKPVLVDIFTTGFVGSVLSVFKPVTD